jgi:hypothetical protein
MRERLQRRLGERLPAAVRLDAHDDDAGALTLAHSCFVACHPHTSRLLDPDQSRAV